MRDCSNLFTVFWIPLQDGIAVFSQRQVLNSTNTYRKVVPMYEMFSKYLCMLYSTSHADRDGQQQLAAVPKL